MTVTRWQGKGPEDVRSERRKEKLQRTTVLDETTLSESQRFAHSEGSKRGRIGANREVSTKPCAGYCIGGSGAAERTWRFRLVGHTMK